MPCIKVARAVLLINPDAAATDIADAVALELGKNWPIRGTRVRNGNAIIRWTVWLEPHLLDTSRSSFAAARVAYATDPNVIKGRPGLRNAAEPELRRLIAEGKSVAEIARHLKVRPATIYLWKQQLGL
jgi:DNA-binding NarL/FixJ family response regulator